VLECSQKRRKTRQIEKERLWEEEKFEAFCPSIRIKQTVSKEERRGGGCGDMSSSSG
jgi:hypothetical protein